MAKLAEVTITFCAGMCADISWFGVGDIAERIYDGDVRGDGGTFASRKRGVGVGVGGVGFPLDGKQWGSGG